MITAALYSSLIVAVTSLTWGFFEAGVPLAASALAGFGILWLLALFIRWRWFSEIGFPLLTLAAAAGLWLGASISWMLVTILGGLAAWDLTAFSRRLRYAAPEDDRDGLERRHLGRLGIVLLAGLLLSTGAMLLRLRFAFEWAVVLVIVSILGISRLIRWLARG